MLRLSFSSILVFILLHFTNTHATVWEVKACHPVGYRTSACITFNKVSTKAIAVSKDRSCYETTFRLGSVEKPKYIQLPYSEGYEAFVQNRPLREMYVAKCRSNCSTVHSKLNKWVRWNIEVIHRKICNSYEYPFEIKPSGRNYLKFRANSKTTNTSFYLPMEMNTRSRIEVLTTGIFWLDKTIKLKNMETSKIYSCLYLLNQSNTYHECSLRNDLEWKMELSSLSKLIQKIEEIKVFAGVTGSGTNSSQSLTFKKLAYLPTFAAFINIGKISIGEVAEIYFEDRSRSFDISKIVMTQMHTGEEYGCVNIYKTIPAKYSCKLQKSKNWLLKVISPEENERNFAVEIIQDTLSSFARNLQWKYVLPYGNIYIKYFNLKTYEKDEITKLKFHFLDKFLRINEISLINNYSEYKFKTNEERKFQNYLVTEFSRITKEKIHCNERNPSIKIVIGLFTAFTAFLIIIIIVLCIRYNTLLNKTRNDYIARHQVNGVNKVNEIKEVDEVDGIDEADQVDEIDEADQVDEIDQVDEGDEINQAYEVFDAHSEENIRRAVQNSDSIYGNEIVLQQNLRGPCENEDPRPALHHGESMILMEM